METLLLICCFFPSFFFFLYFFLSHNHPTSPNTSFKVRPVYKFFFYRDDAKSLYQNQFFFNFRFSLLFLNYVRFCDLNAKNCLCISLKPFVWYMYLVHKNLDNMTAIVVVMPFFFFFLYRTHKSEQFISIT